MIVVLLGLLYSTLLATPIFAKTEIVEGGMAFTTNTYFIPPATKWGFASLSGSAYNQKSVTSCVGACTTSGWQSAYEVTANHAGWSWNTFYAFYNFR